MSSGANGSEPLLEEVEELRPIGDIEARDRRRRKDLDRESARAVKGGATRGRARENKLCLYNTTICAL